MAVVVKDFLDFETGFVHSDADPLDFAGAVGNDATLVTSPAPPYGTYTLQITQHKDNSFFRGPLHTYTASTVMITSAYVGFSSGGFPPSDPADSLVAMEDESNNVFWKINLKDVAGSGFLDLVDSAGTSLDTFQVSGNDMVRYRIEVVWEPNNGASDWAWYVSLLNEAPVLAGSGTGDGDFSPVGVGTQVAFLLRGQGGLSDPSPMTAFHGGCYMLEGATDIEDRVGGAEGKTGDWHSIGYTNGRITLDSATPDCDEDGNTGSLDALDYGKWLDTATVKGDLEGDLDTRTDDDTGVIGLDDTSHGLTTNHTVHVEWGAGRRRGMSITSVSGPNITVDGGVGTVLPAAATAVTVNQSCTYSRAGADPVEGGGAKVAAPASDPTDVVIAAKWVIRGSGGGLNLVYGLYDPDAATFVVANEAASSFHATALYYYRKIIDNRAPAVNRCPTYLQQMVIGMLDDAGGRGTVINTLTEAHCYTLHAVPILTGKPSIGRFGNAWRGKIGRPL